MYSYKAPTNVNIVYFSGTGGTARTAKCLAETLALHQVAVQLHELCQKPLTLCKTADMLILLYPVYAMNAPTPVMNFIKNLDPIYAVPTVVLSISGGGDVFPNTACRVQCNRLLQKRGYPVVYEKMLVMPSNFAVKTPDSMAVQLLRILPLKIEKLVADLLSGTVRRSRPNPIDRALSFCARLERFGGRMLGRYMKADQNCNSCGLCAKNCPVGNITMVGGRPVYGKNCTLCLKCIYGCPQKALQPKFGKSVILKGGFNIAELEKEIESIPAVSAEQLPDSYAMSGVKKYILEDED